ncbi:MAG: hypothetical protein IJC25_01170 [Clostridia bacterium]|nr:hypothetical protein [Clostridia bacterium]
MKQRYLAYAQKMVDLFMQNYDENIAQLSAKAVESANNAPLSNLVYLAMIDALQYRVSSDLFFAQRAKRTLMDLHRNKAVFDGMTDFNSQFSFKVMDFMFMPNIYLRTWNMLHGSGVFSAEEDALIEQNVTEGVEPIFTFPEWGSHNRAVLRALNLSLAAKYFPNNKNAAKWRKMGEYLMEESFGKWTIEDGATYNPVWLNAILVYAEEMDRPELFDSPAVKYYAEYFAHLLPPSGIYPEFGDARWGTNWAAYVCCLERLAAVYKNGHYKYTAERMFEVMEHLDPGTAPLTLKMGHAFVEAYLWEDESVRPVKPNYVSEEALCDTVGKKIVFRSGVEADDDYLLLNYRDEVQTNRLGQYYLRNTIPVHAEKTHHGHSDENAICHYEHSGSVLLHDGGYRPRLRRNGEWRADYFHNTVVVRKGRYMGASSFFEYLDDGGDYKRTATEKVLFDRFEHLDVSRTRSHILDSSTVFDRSICYFKRERMFLVVDSLRVTVDGGYVMAPLFFGGECEKRGDGHYVTRYAYIGSDEFTDRIPNGGGKLHVYYVGNHSTEGVERVSRSYTEESVLYRYDNRDLCVGETAHFVTLLCPDDCFSDRISARLTYEGHDGVGVEVQTQYGTYRLGFKSIDELGKRVSTERPTYAFERSSVDYGGLVSDGVFVFTENGADNRFGFLAGTRVDLDGSTVFEAPQGVFMQADYTWDNKTSLWRKWEDVIQ